MAPGYRVVRQNDLPGLSLSKMLLISTPATMAMASDNRLPRTNVLQEKALPAGTSQEPDTTAASSGDADQPVRGNTLAEIIAWVESWNTPGELPEPASRDFR